jgi:signal transduction histidine kinase/DNA-binding response OmpR family regulator/HAMP domain-containing protein
LVETPAQTPETIDTRLLLKVLMAFKKGDFSARLPVEKTGTVGKIYDALNEVIEHNENLTNELVRVYGSVAKEGKIGERAALSAAGGCWRVCVDSVNGMIAGLVQPVSEVARVMGGVAKGDLAQSMALEVDGRPLQGEFLRNARLMNTALEQLGAFAAEVTRMAREVGTEGKLGGQAVVKGVGGIWNDLTESVNGMAESLTSQVRNIAVVTTAVAEGDLSTKITVIARGEFLELKNTMNTMVDQLNAFASEVTRMAREVGTEGKLGGQAHVTGVAGVWKDLTESVNSMAVNLTNQVRNIAAVTTAVAKGDLSTKIAVDARGEILEVKNTINTMVDQLNAFASEVTRVAREVGTDGKLGGQAEVKGVAGVWKDLTDNVNFMAANLTTQVRGIAKVVTAVANGDLKRKLLLETKGEITELADTINEMIDTLAVFADQVTTVAREVGIEGKLGGQASVPGAAGMWRDLTNNVNQLAANLTTQVRAIAEVATAVTKGDLARSIALEAQGEMAALKDNLNEMILNLRETTRKNTEQDWLKSNLARFTGMVQGQRNLLAFSQLVLSELAPLVGAQHGVFYFKESEGSERGTLKLFSSYAYRERKNVSNRFRLGEGLVGQCALEKNRILLTDVPSEYIRISSGLGQGAPLNVIVLPVLFEGEVKAVIELASFSSYSEIHLAFLDQLTESIGIALNTIAATMRTEELLNQERALATELQSRQEDLTGTNQRLEQQATTLQASEHLLKKQREELRSKNEELQEKAKLLADQKVEAEVKNNEVEQARQDLEDKATQLTLTSKYKSEFLANMSHELRTPLNNLLILARLLADNAEGNLTEKQTKFAHTIHSSGTDLLTLINDILDLARVESGRMNVEPAAVYLADLREQAIQDFSHVALSKGIEFGVHADPGLPDSIQTDATRLHQVLKNLISNALKFTERGSVRMEIKPAKSGWRPGNLSLDRAERVVAFSVVDTGIGIPPEKHRTVFEAFQQADGTTSRRYGGTGLGLSISREIAQLLGGDLTLQSQAGLGSTFTLFLPAIYREEMQPSQPAAGAEAIPAAPPRPRPPDLASACDAVAPAARAKWMGAQEAVEDDRLTLQRTDRMVLIVENDITFASLLLEKVRTRGLKGVIVMGGGPVMKMVREMAPVAVTLDIMLPDMSGWAVLDALKRDPGTRHIPVHVVTIANEHRRAMAMGAASFCPKTLKPEELDAVFDRIVSQMNTPVREVVVVDGDPARLQSLVELLGNGDIHTIPATTGAEVSAALREQKIDGVVLGWNVPGLAGLDLLTTLRDATRHGELRVLIYPAAPLSQAERAGIAGWDDTAAIQIASSPEDLLHKSMTMFHRKETELSQEKRDKLATAHAADQKLSGRKILIVDDDLRNIFALTSALETHEMKLTLAENGRKGIEALRANPDVELVLMDIMMPEMDGFEAMRAIRKMPEYRELPIIALTAQAMKGDRVRCIEAGATDYIAKPVEIDQLLALMRVWLPEARKV